MAEDKAPFGYEECMLTVDINDNDRQVTFAPLAKDEVRITDCSKDDGLVYALAVAAAGRHHMLVYGQPGTGFNTVTKKITQFLPNLSADEQPGVNRIYHIAGLKKPDSKIVYRPFRMPHTTASIEGMCGGGPKCMPGEVSLAHNGVLYLEDAAEFRTSVLQMLRVPLENGNITLSRAGRSTTYPANFQLVMTTNPCPCGNYGSPDKICLCSAQSIRQYWKKFSAPLLERITIRYNCNEPVMPMFSGYDELRKRIREAVSKQTFRQGKFNQNLTAEETAQYCKLTENARKCLDSATLRYGLTPREISCILKLARTVLDLKDGSWDEIGAPSMSMALSLFGNLPEAAK